MFSITGAGSCSVKVCVLLVVTAPYWSVAVTK
jgi:hypothetical protein